MAHGNLEDLVIYRTAERYCDRIHTLVQGWPGFDKQTLGSQIVRAADSVGANIAESYGRFRMNDKSHFLYIARGSAYETTFWLRRAEARGLFDATQSAKALDAYETLIVSLNAYIRHTKSVRHTSGKKGTTGTLAESPAIYETDLPDSDIIPF